jgi:type II secretory ATPase GspE/PulE/Tfp pilus assembly ATPase PilB-like protein
VIIACAQRLMRRICNYCKEPVSYPAVMYRDLNIPPSYFEGATIYRGRGCERCHNTGYAGRLAILEAMTITDEIRKAIIARQSAMEIAQLAIKQGMKTLRVAALEKVREGLSTLEQTLIVTATH